MTRHVFTRRTVHSTRVAARSALPARSASFRRALRSCPALSRSLTHLALSRARAPSCDCGLSAVPRPSSLGIAVRYEKTCLRAE